MMFLRRSQDTLFFWLFSFLSLLSHHPSSTISKAGSSRSYRDCASKGREPQTNFLAANFVLECALFHPGLNCTLGRSPHEGGRGHFSAFIKWFDSSAQRLRVFFISDQIGHGEFRIDCDKEGIDLHSPGHPIKRRGSRETSLSITGLSREFGTTLLTETPPFVCALTVRSPCMFYLAEFGYAWRSRRTNRGRKEKALERTTT